MYFVIKFISFFYNLKTLSYFMLGKFLFCVKSFTQLYTPNFSKIIAKIQFFITYLVSVLFKSERLKKIKVCYLTITKLKWKNFIFNNCTKIVLNKIMVLVLFIKFSISENYILFFSLSRFILKFCIK